MNMKRKFRALVLRNKKNDNDPADYMFGKERYSIHGYYIFEDGSIGYVGDPEFDLMDFIEIDDDHEEMYDLIDDYKHHLLKKEQEREVEEYIRDQFDGMLPIGNLYIEAWYPDGTRWDSECTVYYEGQTLGDWCDENYDSRPIMEAPDEAVEMLDNKDWEGLKKFLDKIPGLKK